MNTCHRLTVLVSLILTLPGFVSLSYAFQLEQQDTVAISEQQLIDAKTSYLKGLESFENENYEEALDYLTMAYTELPKHAGVNFALADAYLQIGDLSNAAYYAKEAAKLEPENKWYHLKLAEIYRHAGRNEDTIKELEVTLKYHPNATDVLFELAQTYADQNELLKSNETYNRLMVQTGPDISIYLQKLKNFSDLGMQDSSVTELQKIRNLEPDNLSTLHLLSNYYLGMKKPEQAKAVLKEALEKNERDPKTRIMLADIYVEEAKWDSVGTLLNDIISDSLIKPQAKLTVTQYLLSRYKQEPSNKKLQGITAALLNEFMNSEPEFGQSYALAADFYTSIRQNDKALMALEKTTELIPSNDTAWRQRMQLLMQAGEYDQVIAIGPRADKYVPQDPFVLYFWGSACLAKGNNAMAVEKLKPAAGLPARKPLKSAIYSALGDAYAGVKNWNMAFKNYEEALGLNPDNDLVLNNYAYFLSLQKQQLEKAEQMALKAVKVAPDNPSYLDTVGWIYYQKGKYSKAREFIQKSLDTGRVSAEVLEHMGDVMNKLNKADEAREWWKKAFQKDSSRTRLKEKISQ